MLLLVLASLWALVLGRITITSNLKLEGTQARIYGAALMVYLIFIHPSIAQILMTVLPAPLVHNEAGATIVSVGLCASIAISMVYVTKSIAIAEPKSAK